MTYKIKNTRAKNVTPAEHKLVVKFAKQCMRELSKKKYELPKFMGTLHITSKYRGQASNANEYGITIDLREYRKDSTFYWEYKSIAKCHVLGTFHSDNAELRLKALVAHEIAHFVQSKYAFQMRPSWREQMRKPHGVGWQKLYRFLRVALINPHVHGKIGGVERDKLVTVQSAA